jgi:hypothetical protein
VGTDRILVVPFGAMLGFRDDPTCCHVPPLIPMPLNISLPLGNSSLCLARPIDLLTLHVNPTVHSCHQFDKRRVLEPHL